MVAVRPTNYCKLPPSVMYLNNSRGAFNMNFVVCGFQILVLFTFGLEPNYITTNDNGDQCHKHSPCLPHPSPQAENVIWKAKKFTVVSLGDEALQLNSPLQKDYIGEFTHLFIGMSFSKVEAVGIHLHLLSSFSTNPNTTFLFHWFLSL